MIMFAGAASVEVLCVLPRFVGQSVRTKGKLDHAPPTTFEVLCAGCAIEGSCASQTHLRRPFHTTMARMGRKAKNKKGVVHQGRSPNEVAAVVRGSPMIVYKLNCVVTKHATDCVGTF